MPIGLFPDMKRMLFVSLVLVASACGTPKSDAGVVEAPVVDRGPSAKPNADPTAGTSDDTLALPGGGTVKVEVDRARLGTDGPRDVKVFARHGTLIALSDTYPSKPQGAGRCQAGGETWFRVIDINSRSEKYARIVDSCVGDEQWGDPPVTVTQDGAKVTLNLLSDTAVDLMLGSDGRVIANR